MTAGARIGIDVRMIGHSGIGTTIRELLANLTDAQRRRLVLFAPPGWRNPYESQMIETPYPIYGLRQHLFLSAVFRRAGIDLLHTPHYDMPYGYSAPFVATVHDLIHVKFPKWSSKPLSGLYATLLLRKVASQARAVITVSESTKRDLIARWPTIAPRVHVVYPAVNPAFHERDPRAVAARLTRENLPSRYFLYVGNLRASKNSAGLLAAYGRLRSSWPECPDLVLAGRNFLGSQLNLRAPGVRHLGEAPFDLLPWLYAGALAFVFPSFYEGFGLPPLEAMACGAPVIASARASLPEVCGDAAAYVDPIDLDGLAAEMRSLAESERKRAALRERGRRNAARFSWRRFARETWSVYETAMAGGRS